MDQMQYRDGQLFCEQVNLDDLAARAGTPLYVYSRRTLIDHLDGLMQAFAAVDPLICYSIKSCGNLHILRLLAQRGAGMDVVSGGELYRAREAGVDGGRIVYAGVGKTDAEIRMALEAGIGWFNIESEAEFENIAAIARQMRRQASAALRVNPDVDARTHAKTTTGKKETKFGVDLERAHRFFERYGKDAHLHLSALHMHIGSPIYTVEPYVEAVEKALQLIADLKATGVAITALDLGGGFGADYEERQTPPYAAYADKLVPLLKPFVAQGGRLILEPGRTIVANAGVLLTRVQYIKMGGAKKFVIVDSGMNHLIRPTLYDSFHFIWPTRVTPMHQPKTRHRAMHQQGLEKCDVVGPICETGDYFARDRALPPVARGDLLAVFTAGAYGMVMASNYNAQPRPAEVLVDGAQATIIRPRETYDDLVAPERHAQPL